MHERDGVRPIIIGHSKGGGVVIETLRALAGVYGDELPLVDPSTLVAEPRTRYADPADRRAAAASSTSSCRSRPRSRRAACRACCAASSSWRACCATCRTAPRRSSASRFPSIRSPGPWRATRTRTARSAARTCATSSSRRGRATSARRAPRHLAADPATRAWIERYRPGAGAPLPDAHDVANLPMAAELWFAIKRAWCGEAQRAARAGKGG